MKLREVLGFEIEYRLRQPSTWLYAAILLGVPFLMLHAIDGGDVHINAPEIVATVSTVLGMVGMLVTAALMGDAAIRDVQHGMHPLFYTLPLRRMDYLGGRFLGALLVNAVLLMGIPLGMLLGSLMPYMPEEMFGPFRAATYVQPYVLLLLPNLVLSAALLFTVAALTRQMLAAYVSGLLLLVGYILAGDMIDGLGNRTLAGLLDPFGLSVLDNLTRYWTAVEQNARPIGFPSLLVWNRLVWLAVAAAALVFLHQRFQFAHPVGRRWRLKRRRATTEPGPDRPAAVSRPAVSPPPAERRFGAGARVRQTLSVTRQALRQVLANRAVLVVLGGLLSGAAPARQRTAGHHRDRVRASGRDGDRSARKTDPAGDRRQHDGGPGGGGFAIIKAGVELTLLRCRPEGERSHLRPADAPPRLEPRTRPPSAPRVSPCP